MNHTIFISIAALCISIASFGFSLYQFRRGQKIKLAEKVNEVILEAYELRRATQDLRHLIDSTNDVDECERMLKTADSVSEVLIGKALRDPEIDLKKVYQVQEKIAGLRLEIDLMHKQVNEKKRLDEEFVKFSR